VGREQEEAQCGVDDQRRKNGGAHGENLDSAGSSDDHSPLVLCAKGCGERSQTSSGLLRLPADEVLPKYPL
jgi:hypothetical protein